jgi:beta-catenin-like protein 1
MLLHNVAPQCSGEREVAGEVEERCVSLIASLLTNLGPKGGRRERVAAKFVEAEFEKCDRLLEIFFRCLAAA